MLSSLLQRLNCGSGDGVEALRIYQLYNPEAYLRHLKELVDPEAYLRHLKELVDPTGGAANIKKHNPSLFETYFVFTYFAICISFTVGTMCTVCFTEYGVFHISGVLIVHS